MIKDKKPDLPKKEKIFVDSSTLEIPFPEAVIAEAEAIATTGQTSIEKEAPNRRDFRDVLTVTIDPVRARDFDDAISIREIDPPASAKGFGEAKQYEIGVHIADVSFYVRPGTKLDAEARLRATSIYLVDRVIPMLPHALSDDLCSLKQGVDRLTFSAVFTLDDNANILSQWFGRTIINSDRRFTYEEVEKITKAGEGEYAKELIKLKKLADKLDKKKIHAGALAFEEDEYAYEVDAEGKPISIMKAERLESHKLVEDFMLLANKQVAEYVSKLVKNRDHAFLYRIHDNPDPEKLLEFMRFAKLFGHSSAELKASKKITPQVLNAFLKTLNGLPEEDVLNDAAVRTMSRATYSTKNIGHFGLAFRDYTHFTSPIRRYPDLVVHRLLDIYLKKEKMPDNYLLELDGLCTHSSEREQFATIAERDSMKLAQCRYLEHEKEKIFDGVIAWMADFGLFVEELSTGARGLVRFKSLPGDYYIFDEKKMTVTGKRHRLTYHLGDTVKIKILSSDPETRMIDFEIVTSA
jgi:ribonuclease R